MRNQVFGYTACSLAAPPEIAKVKRAGTVAGLYPNCFKTKLQAFNGFRIRSESDEQPIGGRFRVPVSLRPETSEIVTRPESRVCRDL
jgi:hypothetical protein